MASLRVVLPGEPHAQHRARAVRFGAHVRMHDAQPSIDWKGAAQVHYQQALREAGLTAPALTGALEVSIEAVFPLPQSKHRKRGTVPRGRHTGAKDADNVAKACMDAGNGLLWLDDRQVARLVVEKWTAAQGEAPHVVVTVSELDMTDPA